MTYDITRPIHCDGGCGHYHEQKGCKDIARPNAANKRRVKQVRLNLPC